MADRRLRGLVIGGWAVQSGWVHQVFLLGAGLGTRLRPLTDRRPKPLVPLFHRPLAAWVVDACREAGAHRFAINTHHLPDAWGPFAAAAGLAAGEVTYFHEPVLLDTGGGLRNIAGWLDDAPLLVHNGDIFSSLPLGRLVEAHRASGLPCTLALRSGGADKRVAFDAAGGRVIDVRHALGVAAGTHVFSGIYCVNPEFLDRIPAGEVVEVIPAFLELAKHGLLGGVRIDDGEWLDLGDRDSYLEAHRRLDLAPAVHPLAEVAPDARVTASVIGPGARIGAGALVRDSVVWPGAQVEPGACLERCIVGDAGPVAGAHHAADLAFGISDFIDYQ